MKSLSKFKNILGQIVFEQRFETPDKNFTTQIIIPNDLSDEIYLVSINTANRQVHKKLIINR